MTGTRTPTLEHVSDHAGVLVQDRPVVSQSMWVQSALQAVVVAERTFFLLTPASSRITSTLRTTMERTGSVWAVRAPDGSGWYDGLRGRALRWDGDTYQPIVGDDDMPRRAEAFDVPVIDAHRQLVVNLTVRHPAATTTELGLPCRVLAEHLTGAPPAGWGTAEPVTLPWRQRELTAFVRDRAPHPTRLTFVGASRAMQGVVDVRRGATGVDESMTAYVAYTQAEAPPVAALSDVLAQLAERCTIVTMLATIASGRADLTHSPRSSGRPTPVTLAVGPEAVAGVGAEAALTAGSSVTVTSIGARAAAGVLYRFDVHDQHTAWRGLDDVACRLRVPELLAREVRR